MYQTSLAYKYETEELLNPNWEYYVTEISKVFRFTPEEIKWFTKCKTAQLIATIPFVANCIEPERTAIAHLCIYIAEIKGFQEFYNHQASDDSDIYNRLAFISTFEGGNKLIIEEGMNLLALIMIEGYYRTKESDKKNNIYNPFVSKTWNYQEIKSHLLQKLSEIKDPFFKNFFNADEYIWK